MKKKHAATERTLEFLNVSDLLSRANKKKCCRSLCEKLGPYLPRDPMTWGSNKASQMKAMMKIFGFRRRKRLIRAWLPGVVCCSMSSGKVLSIRDSCRSSVNANYLDTFPRYIRPLFDIFLGKVPVNRARYESGMNLLSRALRKIARPHIRRPINRGFSQEQHDSTDVSLSFSHV